MNLVTGGGPGLMDAASVGHHAGDVSHKALSIDLQIKIPKSKETLIISISKKRFFSKIDRALKLRECN